MRFILLFWLTFSYLLAFDLSIKSGKSGSNAYAIVNLSSDEFEFTCEEIIDQYMEIVAIECYFPRGFYDNIEDLTHHMLSLSFDKQRTEFTLQITTEHSLNLFATSKPFYEQNQLEFFDKDKSDQWVVIVYQETLPFITQRVRPGMNFPIPRDFNSLPSVGAVDVDSKPVTQTPSADVDNFIRLQERYDRGDYAEARIMAKELISEFEYSIFLSDFIRYKIKSMQQISVDEYFDEIIDYGMVYIRNFTSDEYLPQVLLIMAKAYAQVGFLSDANYFFDRLVDEHGGSYYGDLASIEYGLYRDRRGDRDIAIETILDTFYDTKYLEVASKAADELANIHLDNRESDKALPYIDTIWTNNKNYFSQKLDKQIEYANRLSQIAQGYALALQMYKDALERLDRHEDPEYEEVLYSIALMHDKMDDFAKAYDAYERYLEEFPNGDYDQEALDALDLLLLKLDGDDIDEQLEVLNDLIDKHGNRGVGQQAVVAKLKLLLDHERYEQATKLHSQIKDLDGSSYDQGMEYMQKVFDEYITYLLQTRECLGFGGLIERFDLEIDMSEHDNIDLFNCYYQIRQLDLAKEVAQNNLDQESMQMRASWLCNLAKVELAMGNYAIAKDIYDDVITMGMQQRCLEIDYNLFEINKRLNNVDEMMQALDRIDEYEDGPRILELYRDMIQATDDDGVKRVYIQRMLQAQEDLNVQTYSPWIELQASRVMQSSQDLAQKLMNVIDYATQQEQARIYFVLGDIYTDLDDIDQAMGMYEECMQIESMWQSLCEDAMGLLQ